MTQELQMTNSGALVTAADVDRLPLQIIQGSRDSHAGIFASRAEKAIARDIENTELAIVGLYNQKMVKSHQAVYGAQLGILELQTQDEYMREGLRLARERSALVLAYSAALTQDIIASAQETAAAQRAEKERIKGMEPGPERQDAEKFLCEQTAFQRRVAATLEGQFLKLIE